MMELTNCDVWEALAKDRYNDLAESVPKEYLAGMNKIAGDLFIQFSHMEARAMFIFAHTAGDTPSEFAKEAMKAEVSIRPILFKMRNGQEIDSLIWNLIKPKVKIPVKKAA